MFYRILTDSIVAIHLLFIVFVIFGSFLVLYKRWFVWIHIPAAIWGSAVELFGWYCPLTPLENWLRSGGNRMTYESGFIEHYLIPIIYPENLTRNVQIVLGLSVLVINVVVYFIVLSRIKKLKHKNNEK